MGRKACQKNRGYNEFGTKGGEGGGLTSITINKWGGGEAKIKRNPYTAEK